MTASVQFGLTLPNRMVVASGWSLRDMISMGVEAEESGLFQSIWVGDSILAKRRPDSVTLLTALAAVTKKVRLAPGCMASFPIRNIFTLAFQWSTLDHIAGPNRVILCVCQGGAGDWEMEQAAYGIPQKTRVRRMIEGIEVLQALWTQEKVSYEGEFIKFQDVISEPRPLTKPYPPIWITANPRGEKVMQQAANRVARLSDGWMTTMLTPQAFGEKWQLILSAVKAKGRDVASLDNTLYWNANINGDREAAYTESKKFLETYYSREFTKEGVDLWVAYGSPQEVIEKLQAFVVAGAKEITIRLTSFDQKGQFKRLMNEVIPAFK